MTGLALLLAASAMGVDYGWRPHEDGGLEYIIQVEPEVFASLQAGGEIVSEIHPQAHDVRRFRIRIGRGKLPRDGGEQLAADDGPLPPAPLGEDTPNTKKSPIANVASTATSRLRSASPPLNHLAQGSGYGGAFGGFSGAYNRAASTSASTTTNNNSTPAAANAANTRPTGSYGTTGSAGSTYNNPTYIGSSRSGNSDYSTGTATTGSTSSSRNPTVADSSWTRGEVRTASNQQPVTSNTAATNATAPNGATTGASTTAGSSTPQYSTQSGTASQGPPPLTSATGSYSPSSSSSGQSQPSAQPRYTGQGQPTGQTQTTSSSQPTQQYATGSSGQATSQPQYNTPTGLGEYSGSATNRNVDTATGGYSATIRDTSPNSVNSNAANDANYGAGRYGPLTPVNSGYDDPRNPPQGNSTQGDTPQLNTPQNNPSAQAPNGSWANTSAQNPQYNNSQPPPTYPPRTDPGYGSNTNYAAGTPLAPPAANPNYAQPPYAPYGQYGAAPPAHPLANYGYAPAGGTPYQYAAQLGAGYGYGQTPGYYAMPPLAPPTLTAASNENSSSSSRSRRYDDDEDEDDRPRRSYVADLPAPPVTPTPAAAPATQPNLVTSEPWLAFTITIVLLFASIGGNIYLLWISQDFYWRYKELANDLRNFNSAG